ncbi:MAG: hypothetical protein JNM84_00770 [Planctomycetes bacterium]|nr:hypothetical protein [Planctomycetota bacterium]
MRIPRSVSRVRLAWVAAAVLHSASALPALADDRGGLRQRALSPAELARVTEFLAEHDRSLVGDDVQALLERYDLGAHESARAWRDQVSGRATGARSSVAQGWRIRDRICVVARTAYEVAASRATQGLRQERIDHRILLLRDEGQSFRVVKLSNVRVSAGASETEDPRELSCEACNFHVEAAPDWFVIHHHAVGGALTEKASLHHASGQATLEIEILELPEGADPRESLELDHELSLALAGVSEQRVKRIDASAIPPDLGGLPGYRLQVTMPRAGGGEEYVARCYRARGDVLYTMTAYGDAAAWDREPGLLEDVEAMFDSFELLQQDLGPEEQRRRMLARHQPGFAMDGNRFRDTSTGLSFVGPEGWSLRPLACGRVRWAPHDGEHGRDREGRPPHRDGKPPHGEPPHPNPRPNAPLHGAPHHGASRDAEAPWVEVTWLSSENGWNDRVPGLMRSFEKTFDSFPEVRRGSVRLLDRAHKRPAQVADQILVTELFTADYAYANPKGSKRRTRMAYIPCGKLMFVVRADAGEEDFLRLESSFEKALASFSLRG